MLRLSLGLVLLAALLSAPAPTRAQTTVQVAMPDGATLATDVWKSPFATGKLPALLRRTPYGRAMDLQVAVALMNAGFVVVSQDVRGRGNSQGTFEPFFDDQVDGRATMTWIAQQDWSNGRVATYSNSAEGIVQFMAMGDAPEALRCAHLGMPTHDAYEGLFPGGAWRTDLGTKWLTDLGAANVVPLWKSHEVHDSYWDDATLTTAEMALVKHPVFILGGMFDIFAPSQVRALRELQTYAAPDARDDAFLIIGPWTHGGIGLRGQGELFYPEDAVYSKWADEMLAYLRWCIQDGERPDFAPVRYYQTEITDTTATDPADNATRIVAQGSWLTSTTWPPPESENKKLFLQSSGVLGDAPAQDAVVALPVDPAAPLASLGGGNLSSAAGPFNQVALDAMPGVFVAATAPVTAPVEIRGNMRLRVWASSATSDVDVIVRAEVLTAMGKAIALTDGVRRGRFVRGTDERVPLVPGEPANFDVLLGPMAVKLMPGQSLRIAISGTSSPRYEPNPNVGDPLVEATPTATTLTLYTDAEHPGELRVPVATGALPGALDVAADDEWEESGDGSATRDGGVAGDGDGGVSPGGNGDGDSESGDGDGATGEDDDAAGSPSSKSQSDCACRLQPSTRPPYGLGGLLLLGLVVRSWQRRRGQP